MDILYLLIPIALVFVTIAIRLFLWAVRSGQYDDLEMEGRRILFEEEPQQKPGDTNEKDEESGEPGRKKKAVRQGSADLKSGDQ